MKDRNVRQGSKFLSKLEFLGQYRNFDEKFIFWQISKVFRKIEILVKNRNFNRKSKCLANIEIFAKKGEILMKTQNFGKITKFLSNINFLSKIIVFGQQF